MDYFLFFMYSLLTDIKDIKITVSQFNNLFVREKDFIYTIDKYNFTTILNCVDTYCNQTNIYDELFKIIQNRLTRHRFFKLCDGKDLAGLKCIAGWDFLVEIKYFDNN